MGNDTIINPDASTLYSDATEQKPKLDPTVDFIAGTISGIVGLSVGFPLDTVKVRLQCPETAPGYQGKSTLGAITRILREERAACAFLNGLIFSSFGFLMRLQLQRESEVPSLINIGLAGAGSGIIASSITCPTELIKIRQQAIINAQPSTKEIALKIIRAHGIQGLFRGLGVTALRDSGYGIYFAVYEATCRFLRSYPASLHSQDFAPSETDPNLEWLRLMLAGGTAGVISWTATFGLDVVKTRVQSSERTRENPFRTAVSTALHSYKSEGFKVFFVGLSPTLIRAFPVNMATFGAFELVMKIFS